MLVKAGLERAKAERKRIGRPHVEKLKHEDEILYELQKKLIIVSASDAPQIPSQQNDIFKLSRSGNRSRGFLNT